MATTTVKSVGTATRDYSTVQAWEDACPANLVTNDEIWKGEMYDDSTFTGAIIIGGITSDSTRYPWLTTAANESVFDDSANALVYDATKGVSWSRTWSSTTAVQFDFGVDYTIVEKIQFKLSNTTGGYYPSNAFSVGDFNFFRNCLIEADVRSGSGDAYVVNSYGYYGGNDATFSNLLIILTADDATDNACAAFRSSAGLFYNCGVVVPTGLTNASTGTHFDASSYQSSTLVKSCYSFNSGGIAFDTGSWETGSDYNASDDTSGPGANSSDSLTYADQFAATDNTDWKLKSGSDLEGAGNTDTVNPNDIYGATRALTTGGDIGPYEFVVGSSGAISSTEPVIFGESAQLNGFGELSATDSTVFSETAQLSAKIAASSTSVVIFGESAQLVAKSTLSATEAILFGESAQITGLGSLAATESIITSESAQLTATGALIGTDSVVFGESANLTEHSNLRTTTSITFGSTAILSKLGGIQSSVGLESKIELGGVGVLSVISNLGVGVNGNLSATLGLESTININGIGVLSVISDRGQGV